MDLLGCPDWSKQTPRDTGVIFGARDKNIHTEPGKFLAFKPSNKGTKIGDYSTRDQSMKVLSDCAQFLSMKSMYEVRQERIREVKKAN